MYWQLLQLLNVMKIMQIEFLVMCTPTGPALVLLSEKASGVSYASISYVLYTMRRMLEFGIWVSYSKPAVTVVACGPVDTDECVLDRKSEDSLRQHGARC